MTIAIRYVPLLVYAAGFVTVPVVRAVRNRLVNRAISERNRNRAAWARALLGSGSDLPSMGEAPPGATTTDAQPNAVTTAMTRAGLGPVPKPTLSFATCTRAQSRRRRTKKEIDSEE